MADVDLRDFAVGRLQAGRGRNTAVCGPGRGRRTGRRWPSQGTPTQGINLARGSGSRRPSDQSRRSIPPKPLIRRSAACRGQGRVLYVRDTRAPSGGSTPVGCSPTGEALTAPQSRGGTSSNQYAAAGLFQDRFFERGNRRIGDRDSRGAKDGAACRRVLCLLRLRLAVAGRSRPDAGPLRRRRQLTDRRRPGGVTTALLCGPTVVLSHHRHLRLSKNSRYSTSSQRSSTP